MSVRVFDIGTSKYIPLEFMTFPGGERHVKPVDGTPLYANGFLQICAQPRDPWSLLDIALVADYCRRVFNPAELTLYMPYFPGARQDRGAPLTVKVYADLINSLEFDTVIIADPHSDVTPALLDNCRIQRLTDIFPILAVPGPDRAVMLAPDAGAIKRVSELAALTGHHVLNATKSRNPQTGALSNFGVPEIRPEYAVIVVDDICDGGGTFLGLADALGIERNRMYLWVTHGIFSKGLRELQSRFQWIGSTDSLWQYDDPDYVERLFPT